MEQDNVASMDSDEEEGWECAKNDYLQSHPGFEFPN
jgi:hypothetical protein